jgi:hypothetical protein
MKRDWIVIRNIPGGYEMSCKRCGDKYEPAMPCLIEVMVAIGKAYGASHAKCLANGRPDAQIVVDGPR